MRGYLSFLIVFASVFLILNLIIASEQPERISFSRAIAAERAYQAQMNAKEAVMEAIRQGSAFGYQSYNASHDQESCARQYYDQCFIEPPGPGCAIYVERCFKYGMPPEADSSAIAGALGWLSALDASAFGNDTIVTISCGGAGTREEAERIMESGNCASCAGLNACGGALAPEFEKSMVPNENPRLANVTLAQPITITVKYPAFGIDAVSFIPAGYTVYP